MDCLVGSSYMVFCGRDWLLRYEVTQLLGFFTCFNFARSLSGGLLSY